MSQTIPLSETPPAVPVKPLVKRAAPVTSDEFEHTIRPPSGFAKIDWSELWRYRDLFLVLAWRDIAVRYKQTVLGVLWAILQPVVSMALYTVIFNRVAHIDSGSPGVPYAIFAYVGLLFWQFYSGILTNASNSMVNNVHLVQKVYFPRLVLPATAATTGLVDSFFAALVLTALMIWYRIAPSVLGVLLLPVMVAIAVFASLGIGLFLAAANVKYRDVRHALPFLIQILMFVTPVIYPSSLLERHPIAKLFILWLNPIAGVITTARATLLHDGPFEPELLLAAGAVSLLLFAAGLQYFRATERYFADIA